MLQFMYKCMNLSCDRDRGQFKSVHRRPAVKRIVNQNMRCTDRDVELPEIKLILICVD